jgi:hypothetical protein
VPGEYKPMREPLIEKMLFERHTHSMGKNSRVEDAAIAGNARQRQKARGEARWPARAHVLAKVMLPWHRIVLVAVLALSAILNLSRLTSEGYGNIYYAATVKNMLLSWHNFFFLSYDAGFVSVDKPPVGFWIQAASAYLFGFHGWSILLPQALAGVLCVALLYYLVSRSFGPVAGLLAALALALTPLSVAEPPQQPRGFAGPFRAPGDLGLHTRRPNRPAALAARGRPGGRRGLQHQDA